jgi:hypothetical protein
MRPRITAWSLLAGLLGLLLGTSLPQRPGPAPERRADVPGCDGRAAWRLAAVEALFTGLPRRPDRDASPLGRALCALPDQPPAEHEAMRIAADPRSHHALGMRIHAAWTAYVGEQPPLTADEIDRLRRNGLDVHYMTACIHRVNWLLQDAPFGTDPIAAAHSPSIARRRATLAAFETMRAAGQARPEAVFVCERTFQEHSP